MPTEIIVKTNRAFTASGMLGVLPESEIRHYRWYWMAHLVVWWINNTRPALAFPIIQHADIIEEVEGMDGDMTDEEAFLRALRIWAENGPPPQVVLIGDHTPCLDDETRIG